MQRNYRFEIIPLHLLVEFAFLQGMEKANITIRNFPSSVAELRKRLRLKEGGEDYIFATTLADESKVLIKCRKCPSLLHLRHTD